MASKEEWYDIVVLGSPGMGKTTLGRKLLAKSIDISCFSGDTHIPTCNCNLLSDEGTKVRVLDVPGLSDDVQQETGQDLAVSQKNQKIFCSIVETQIKSNLEFKCVLYFLPTRGSLEKADGILQQELEQICHFFGSKIFEYMLVIATASPKKKWQDIGLDDEELEHSKEVFHLALKAVLKEQIACPPVIYIGLNDSPQEIQSKITLLEQSHPLTFEAHNCNSCSPKANYVQERQDSHGIQDIFCCSIQ